MKPKHLLSVRDLSAQKILFLIKQAKTVKKAPEKSSQALAGKTLGLLFQKPSVRTRVSFEVGMLQLGGQALYMDSVDLGGNKRESPRDLARVLSRYLDGIVARTFSHDDVADLAKSSEVPVINGLSNYTHPCQALGDLLTIQEHLGKLAGVHLAYVGDGNNVCQALIEACALVGMKLSISTPKSHAPNPATVKWAQGQLKKSGGSLCLRSTPQKAVAGAQVVYTDVWTSMGQEKERGSRLKTFKPYQVNKALFKLADKKALFMHCLPAHRGEEVTDEVMDSSRSIVYDQAENRLHIQKAILLELMQS